MAEAAAPPVGSTGDIGYTCGQAAFDWRLNTGALTGIRQGDSACVVLLSNSTSIEMWNRMVSAGGTAASDLFSSLAGPVVAITAKKEAKSYVVSQLKNAGYVLLSAAAPELAAASEAYSKFTTAMKAIRYAAYPICLANYKAILVGGKGCYGIVFGVHQGHPVGWISPIGRLYHYNGNTRDGVYDHAGHYRASNLECAEQNGAHNAPGLEYYPAVPSFAVGVSPARRRFIARVDGTCVATYRRMYQIQDAVVARYRHSTDATLIDSVTHVELHDWQLRSLVKLGRPRRRWRSTTRG